MIQWKTVTWYSQLVAILLAVLIFLVGFYAGSKLSTATSYSAPEVEKEESNYEMPILSLPVSYFEKERIVGSGEYRTGEEYFILHEGYHSVPTTTILLSEDNHGKYSNEIKSLPALKTTEEILSNAVASKDLMEMEIEEYGDFAKRYLPDTHIFEIKTFDVDGDGGKEHIISTCGWGGNGCPHEALIVKDGQIIFSVDGVIDPEIVTSGTSNGFYVQWAPWRTDGSKWDVGLCCMPGYFKTRFMYDNGKFVPVYEQEVLHFRVKDRNVNDVR